MRYPAIAALFLCLALPLAAPAQAVDRGGGVAVSSGPDSDEARIPFKPESDSGNVGLAGRVLGGFVVVALLAVASVYVLKRYFPSFYVHSSLGAKHIQVLEVRRLTPRTTLFLVELDGARLLLAQSGDRVVSLHRTSAASEKPSDVTSSQ